MSPNANAAVAYGQISTVSPVVEEERLASASTKRSQVAYTSTTAHNRTAVEQQVRQYFSDIPIMAEIARCESTFRHTMADGTVLRGYVDNADTGVMQINTRYHQARADALGLDLTDINDNMAYARDLYERKGTQPWNASAPCWNRHVATTG